MCITETNTNPTNHREFSQWYSQPTLMSYKQYIIHCHFAELGIGYYFQIPALQTNPIEPDRSLSKLAYTEGFERDSERRTAAYLNVREDSSTESTSKSPAEVEFLKKSILRYG